MLMEVFCVVSRFMIRTLCNEIETKLKVWLIRIGWAKKSQAYFHHNETLRSSGCGEGEWSEGVHAQGKAWADFAGQYRIGVFCRTAIDKIIL